MNQYDKRRDSFGGYTSIINDPFLSAYTNRQDQDLQIEQAPKKIFSVKANTKRFKRRYIPMTISFIYAISIASSLLLLYFDYKRGSLRLENNKYEITDWKINTKKNIRKAYITVNHKKIEKKLELYNYVVVLLGNNKWFSDNSKVYSCFKKSNSCYFTLGRKLNYRCEKIILDREQIWQKSKYNFEALLTLQEEVGKKTIVHSLNLPDLESKSISSFALFGSHDIYLEKGGTHITIFLVLTLLLIIQFFNRKNRKCYFTFIGMIACQISSINLFLQNANIVGNINTGFREVLMVLGFILIVIERDLSKIRAKSAIIKISCAIFFTFTLVLNYFITVKNLLAVLIGNLVCFNFFFVLDLMYLKEYIGVFLLLIGCYVDLYFQYYTFDGFGLSKNLHFLLVGFLGSFFVFDIFFIGNKYKNFLKRKRITLKLKRHGSDDLGESNTTPRSSKCLL